MNKKIVLRNVQNYLGKCERRVGEGMIDTEIDLRFLDFRRRIGIRFK